MLDIATTVSILVESFSEGAHLTQLKQEINRPLLYRSLFCNNFAVLIL